MERIDILSPKIDEGAEFVVDTSVDSVDLTPVVGATNVLYAGGGSSKFARGDNFIILSAGYFIPEAFALYGYGAAGIGKWSLPVMLFRALTDGGFETSLYEFGDNGMLRIPYPNAEISIGTYCDPEKNSLNDNFVLKILFPNFSAPDHPQISMVGVPVSLDGKMFYVVPFVKILHNLALIG